MGINRYKLKKWKDMILGKSIHHVNQNEGLIFSVDLVKGYYNNLTEKVTRRRIDDNSVPKSFIDSGDEIYFSIEIFQYGLGAYDLFLLNNDKEMLKKAISCANWAVENQKNKGAWPTFAFDNPTHPYSAMAQGEGISLLVRIYLATSEIRYLQVAKKAVEFMLLSIEDGGTAKYEGNNVYLYERTEDPLVLNGWIFSYWGLLDYWKITQDEKLNKILKQTIEAMKNLLSSFDIGYWSKYDINKMICSPFYHRLHIAQLKVM